MPTPYNILSLDGGGSWALIQVKCLQKLFGAEARGHEILRRFHLVAANSGGSIVLAGLVADLPLSAILDLFLSQEKREAIFFPTSNPLWHLEHGLAHLSGGLLPDVGPRYSTERKLAALLDHLPGIATLCLDQVAEHVGGPGAKTPQVLIPTFNYNTQRSTFFRSDRDSYGDSVNLEGRLWHTTPAQKPGKAALLLEAVHASSTAPVLYFDDPAEVAVDGKPTYLWDGGVAGYNNPVLAAVTEALVNEAAQVPRDIRVLSIGTGTGVTPVLWPPQEAQFEALITRPVASESFLSDVRKLASAVVGAPPDAASFVAYTVLNRGFVEDAAPRLNFIRANPSVQPRLVGDRWLAPPGFNEADIAAIRKLELDAITPEAVALIVRLCDAWLADALPNQPIRASSALECLVGQPTFSEVARQFQQLFPIPTVLSDLSRLPEIYALRVAAWEQSPGQPYVNAALFPNGWSDALDTHSRARHWVVEVAGEIVAAARVVLLDSLEESGQPDFGRFALPPGRPWGYLSRLVIQPAYRKQGLALLFDQARMASLRESGVAFALVSINPKRLPQLLEQGWAFLGDIYYHSGGDSPQHLPEPLCLWQPGPAPLA